MTIIKNGIVDDAAPVHGNPARPRTKERPDFGECVMCGTPTVAVYKWYGFTAVCPSCDPDGTEDEW